jgi:hypothetical protein
MKTRNISILTALIIVIMPDLSFSKDKPTTAYEVLNTFYIDLLNYNYYETPELPRPEIKLSASFQELISKSNEACAKYEQGPCGFEADGDPYLSTQENGEDITHESAKLKVIDLGNNIFEVKFNLFPSLQKDESKYQVLIHYKMIYEANSWAVDDIIYDGVISTREALVKEMEFITANYKKLQHQVN